MAILTAVEIGSIVNRGERVFDNRYTSTEKDIDKPAEIPVSDPTLPPLLPYLGIDANAIGILGKAIQIATPTNNQVLKYDSTLDKWIFAADVAGSSGVWGSITGTLSSQTDLNTALGLKANTASLATVATSGSASDLGTGTLSLARLSGITTTQLSGTAGITNAQLAGSIALSKLSITGTPDGSKYLRDDGSWQAVAGSLIVGTSAITSGTSGRLLYNNAGVLGSAPLNTNALNATYLDITSAAAGNGFSIGVGSSGTNENLILLPKGAGTSFSARPIFIGASATTTNSVDSWITINRLVDDATLGAGTGINGHGFSDSSVVSRTGVIGYAAFDARFTATGTTNFDHFAMYQSAPTIGTSGSTSEIYGLYHSLNINTGSVASAYGLYVAASTGTGTIGTEYGIKIKTLTKGAARYGIYVEGNNSYFNGQIQVGLNTPAIISAPTDGAITIAAAGTNKSVTLQSSGTAVVSLVGPTEVTGGYFYNDRTSTPAYIINTGGANYGHIFTNGTTAFSLGYGTTKTVAGTAAITWTTTAKTVTIGANASATPAVNTLVVGESSRGGTDTNVAGANGIIQSGIGTGTATPASLLLKSTIPAASGTTAQTAATGLEIVNGTARLSNYTVAALPSATVSGVGALAMVTDANATTRLSTVAAGGANKVPVFSDGTNWLIL